MVLGELIQSSIDAVGDIVSVATQGPVEAVLVAMGALLVTVSMVVFGLLVLGAVVDLVTPGGGGATHPQE